MTNPPPADADLMGLADKDELLAGLEAMTGGRSSQNERGVWLGTHMHAVIAALRRTPSPVADEAPRSTYAPHGLEYAAVDQHDVWLLRFSDQDCGDQWFGGEDYTAEETREQAIAAWNRYAPAWSVRLMRTVTLDEVRAEDTRAALQQVQPLNPHPGYAPCPTCKQYSHSLGEDAIADAFNHFQSLFSHRGDGIPTQHNFDERTRDAAQALMAAIRQLDVRPETEG